VAIDVTCAKGTQQAERWTFTAADSDVTSGNIADIAWSLAALSGEAAVASAACTLRIAKAAAGTGVARKVLCIGDSTGTGWLGEFFKLFADDAAMDTALQGTRTSTVADSASGGRSCKHESWTGSKWNDWYQRTCESYYAPSQLSGWTFAGHTGSNTYNMRLFPTLTQPQTNRITDGGMENWTSATALTSWTKYLAGGVAALDREGTIKHGGSYSAKLTNGASAGHYAAIISADITNIVPGQTYRFSVWHYGDGTNNSAYNVEWWTGASWTGQQTGVLAHSAASWGQVSVDVVAPANATKARLTLRNQSAAVGQVSYFDDASVVCLTDRLVQLFKDRDGAAGNRVAYGSRDGDGTITLVQDNASGITGSVTVAYTGDDTGLPSSNDGLDGNLLLLNSFIRSAGAAPTAAFNFAQYLTDTSQTMATSDWVLIHLGINDIGSLASDAAVHSYITATLQPALEAIVGLGASPAAGSIRAGVASIRVGLMLTIPPSADQDAYGAAGSGVTRERGKRNVDLLREWIIETYGSLESSGIYLVPVHANLDTFNNMSVAGAAAINSRTATTMTRQNNSVHPLAAGYYQMADSVYSFLKCMED
jgi:lysophospholipase L1-like esterase